MKKFVLINRKTSKITTKIALSKSQLGVNVSEYIIRDYNLKIV